MKKLTLVVFAALLSIINLTYAQEVESCRCANKALKAYVDSGVKNDYGPFTLTRGTLIAAGETFVLNQWVSLAAQEQDTILFKFSGSVHSGYFQDGVLVDAESCGVLAIFNIAAE